MAQPLAPAPDATGEHHQLGTWRGEGVRIGQVLEALDGLRRAEARAATRTSVVNLVIVAPDQASASRAGDAVHRMGGRHPGRSVVVVCQAGDEPGMDAVVALHGAKAGGQRVWSEDISLSVRGPLSAHLDSVIEPLTLPDLPVVVWFTGKPPGPSDPLLAAADAVVVDTREPASEQLAAVAALKQRYTVLDLAWIRLQPWRALLAGLFDGAGSRPFVRGVTTVRVSGKPGARLLLGGWLMSRLGLAPTAVEQVDGRHAAVSMEAEHEGVPARFRVWRAEGERAVQARSEVAGQPVQEDRLALPDDSMSWSLAEALTHLRRDRVHAAALQTALALPPPPGGASL